MKQVIIQKWTETESGWGQRPDGHTAHLTEADRVTFIKRYNDQLNKHYGSQTPPEYSFPDDDNYVGDVSKQTYKDLIANRKDANAHNCFGIWFGNNYPPKHTLKLSYDE